MVTFAFAHCATVCPASFPTFWQLNGGSRICGPSPSPIVYVLGPHGRISFVVNGNADTISAAVRAL